MHDFAVRPRSIRPEIPPALEELVLRALARDAADRPASATQFGEWLAHPEGMRNVPPPPSPDLIRWPSWSRTAAWVIVVLCVVVLFAWGMTMLAKAHHR